MNPAETQPPGGVDALPKARLRRLMTEARERTLAIVAPVAENDLNRVHDPLMSPLVWDLGHIAAFEDLWGAQRAGGLELLRPDLAEIYDAGETPRLERGEASYLHFAEAREYMAAVRARTLAVLDRSDVSGSADPLHREGFVWELLVRHEQQHNETMLQTLALARPGVYRPTPRELAPVEAAGTPPDVTRVEAGPFPMGAGPQGFAYDNERPQHEVDLRAFEIDTAPVTNGDYREFVEAGGYSHREWWSEAGWAWRRETDAERPLYWTEDGCERSFESVEPLREELPVMHVSWYEAEAFARSRGMRLPTEAEWEKAASWDADACAKRRYPWGDDPPSDDRTGVDQLGFGPAPAAAPEAGASPWGVVGMIGDAWEWTASEFRPYPGFTAFPYREYSEVFFGPEHRVLRGGSWATWPRAASNTVRNWDLPQRRQIYAGFRCARDAE